jgi:CRP-like cAMP-binding protein
VTATRDSELRFISRASFETAAESQPLVYRHVMSLLARRLRDTNAVVAATSFLPLKGRVAHALLGLAEAFGHDVGQGRIVVRQKVTQSDLAAMAGIARENVSRILNDWMRARLVTRLSGYYCLENRAALARETEM